VKQGERRAKQRMMRSLATVIASFTLAVDVID